MKAHFILVGVLGLFFLTGCETTRREVSAHYPVDHPVGAH